MIKFKKILGTFLIVILSMSMISCFSKTTEDKTTDTPSDANKMTYSENSNSVTGELKVHFLNIGEADSILIEQNNEYMLIDAGNEENEEFIKKYLDLIGVKEFKYVVATHPHNNHIGSMDYIVNTYNIENLYFPSATTTTKAYSNFISAVNSKNIKLTSPKVGETFNLGQAKCTILAPNSLKYEDLNNYSIVVKIEFGNNSFLFDGDAEKESENEMLLNNLDLKADVIKIGNSGSKSATAKEFLNEVNPKYAIISVGSGNEYGYPHKETLDKLISKNIEVYRTDINGTIVAISDGDNIKFETEK